MAERDANTRGSFDDYFLGITERLIDMDHPYRAEITTSPPLKALNTNLDFIKVSSEEVTRGKFGQDIIIRPLSKAIFEKLKIESTSRLEMISYEDAGKAQVIFEYLGPINHTIRAIIIENGDRRACITWRNGRRINFASWQEVRIDGGWSVVSEEGLSVEEALQISLSEKKLLSVI